MTSTPYTRAFVREAARNRLTLGMPIIVPTVFVVFASQSLVNSAKVFEASGNGAAVDVATAGWAAGFAAACTVAAEAVAERAGDGRQALRSEPVRG